MIPVLLALLAGTLFGYALRRHERILTLGDHAITIAICVLLFLLGVSVGANESLVRSLHRLGLDALVLSLAGTAGSILLCGILLRTAFLARDNEE